MKTGGGLMCEGAARSSTQKMEIGFLSTHEMKPFDHPSILPSAKRCWFNPVNRCFDNGFNLRPVCSTSRQEQQRFEITHTGQKLLRPSAVKTKVCSHNNISNVAHCLPLLAATKQQGQRLYRLVANYCVFHRSLEPE